MGAVTKEIEKHNRSDRVDINRDQAIVERLNRTLAERLFGHQYAFEIRLLEGQRSSKWVVWLPSVVSALNGEVTRLTCKKLTEPPKKRPFIQKPATSYHRPVGVNEKRLPSAAVGAISTNPMSLKAKGKCTISKNPSPNPNEPILYYLHNGHKRGFVREELLVVPANTELPLHL